MEMATLGKLVREVLLAGLILFDGTKAYRAPGDKDAVALYDTGTRVEIIQERSVPDGAERFYQIKRASETVWVQAKAVKIIAKEEDSYGLPKPFYLRAAKSKDEGARALAAGGLMRLLKGPELRDAWVEFQRDQADEVRCAANEFFSRRALDAGLPADQRFNDGLLEALLRVKREGGWGDETLCGLNGLLARSSHPDKTAMQCMLAQRHLGECPKQAGPQDKARALELLRRGLGHPEAWVRGNIIAQLCSVFEETKDDVVRMLPELFPSLTPEDKAAVIGSCAWLLKDREAARPLLRQIAALIDDKSQPAKLRLRAVENAYDRRADQRGAIRRIFSDPRDELRFDLAARYCKHKDIIEEASNHGDAAVFASVLMCLDKMLSSRPGPYPFDENLAEWSKPALAARLKSIADPERRERLERPLKCLLGQALCPVSMPAGPNRD